ncbi:MAG: multidrug efflux SMR transporter [Solibacillus sp.]
MSAYLLLTAAIIAEVFASSMLKLASSAKKWLPVGGIILGYLVAFYTLSLSLRAIPLGTAYAIWSGVGTALTAMVGVFFYKEHFNTKKLLGLGCIIGGVILLNIGGTH